MTPAQHHDVMIVLGTLLFACGAAILLATLTIREGKRRPAPPPAAPVRDVPTQRYPVFNVVRTQPYPRAAQPRIDDTAVLFRVQPEDITRPIPRHGRGGRRRAAR